jgi:hypothetical protein
MNSQPYKGLAVGFKQEEAQLVSDTGNQHPYPDGFADTASVNRYAGS